jgi:hypothetical protein
MKINREYIAKNELIILDILANNNWKRPVYYLYPNAEGSIGLGNYTRLEGFAYQLIPIYTRRSDNLHTGRIETAILYDNLMNKFRWGGMNKKDVLIDDQNLQTAVILKMRINFARLAEQLFREGKKDSARNVIARCIELMPNYNYPHDIYSLEFAESAYKVEAYSLADQVVMEYAKQCFQDLIYYHAMPPHLSRLVETQEILASRAIHQLIDMTGKYGRNNLNIALKKKLMMK